MHFIYNASMIFLCSVTKPEHCSVIKIWAVLLIHDIVEDTLDTFCVVPEIKINLHHFTILSHNVFYFNQLM